MFHHIWRWEPVFEASSEEQLWEDFQQLCHSQFQSKASQEIKTRSNFQNTLQELGADVSRVAFCWDLILLESVQLWQLWSRVSKIVLLRFSFHSIHYQQVVLDDTLVCELLSWEREIFFLSSGLFISHSTLKQDHQKWTWPSSLPIISKSFKTQVTYVLFLYNST